MNEDQIEARVTELVNGIAEVLGNERDPAVMLAVIGELLAILLWTYPEEAREKLLKATLQLTRGRLKIKGGQAPLDLRLRP